MIYAYRVDASVKMGTGHVMRCLTLAQHQRDLGHSCYFLCRHLPGNLINIVRSQGFEVCVLPYRRPEAVDDQVNEGDIAHKSWLGESWQIDALQTRNWLKGLRPDWLIVDHYALDHRWEEIQRDAVGRILVIDDLSDRAHECDVLLDQTFGKSSSRYQLLVPDHCTVLAGSKFSLLRPEFSVLRDYSLERRKKARLDSILVTLGGTDYGNVTTIVLEAIKELNFAARTGVVVVMGWTAPWLDKVIELAQSMQGVTVLTNVTNMAEVMANADLCVGAGGTTAWERCCMGLPTLMLVLANNQQTIAKELADAGAARIVEPEVGAIMNSLEQIACSPDELSQMSEKAGQICDGLGVKRVTKELEKAKQ